MKKGFTLIELLAVIIILGILGLIAIPVVTKLVEESKIETFKITSLELINAASNKCQRDFLHEEDVVINYKIADKTINPELDLKGELPKSGYINVNKDCEIEVKFENDKLCITKNFLEEKITLYTDGCP